MAKIISSKSKMPKKRKLSYEAFLQKKMAVAHNTGFKVKESELTPTLFPHVKDTVRWAVEGGFLIVWHAEDSYTAGD